ncbi:catalase [Amycolatopsis regifaucium]|uniref:catalase n=1 Tax=Amycolatopsis regifaucium TaxID=546365 RepID=UPI003CC62D8A
MEAGRYPEWEPGVQLVDEDAEHDFDFDVLDPTKLIPEEQVPVRPVGRMVLGRNPDDFFAETEQIAFHTANVVPGIDFGNDPLSQARNFSYLDTQLVRLGDPNFPQLPVNRPIAQVHTNQRDGHGQQGVHKGRTSYFPNSLGGCCPAIADSGVFRHYIEAVAGRKIRERSESFKDFYSQATLFWNSMTAVEREHIVTAFRFELGKVEDREVRVRTITELDNVDHDLAARVAEGIGVSAPAAPATPHHDRTSPALSQLNQPTGNPASRKVAVLAADGVDTVGVGRLVAALTEQGAIVEVLAPTEAELRPGGEGDPHHGLGALRRRRRSVRSGCDRHPGTRRLRGPLRRRGVQARQAGCGVRFGSEPASPCRNDGETADDAETLIDQGVVTTTAAEQTIPDGFFASFLAQLGEHRSWLRKTDSIPA